MKILKPGKVEQRKFVCPNCECEFVIYKSEATRSMDLEGGYHYWAQCPCRDHIEWDSGEPYEEPTLTLELKERLYGILLTANPNATTTELTDLLFENGVTFREG